MPDHPSHRRALPPPNATVSNGTVSEPPLLAMMSHDPVAKLSVASRCCMPACQEHRNPYAMRIGSPERRAPACRCHFEPEPSPYEQGSSAIAAHSAMRSWQAREDLRDRFLARQKDSGLQCPGTLGRVGGHRLDSADLARNHIHLKPEVLKSDRCQLPVPWATCVGAGSTTPEVLLSKRRGRS
jgi:hypothetical protein